MPSELLGVEIYAGTDQEYIALKICPDCNGRGWLIDKPFAQYNKRTFQCKTCVNAKAYFDEHGKLPEELIKRIESKK